MSARRHHHEIGEHVTRPDKMAEGLQSIGDLAPGGHDVGEDGFVFRVPRPRIVKRPNLRRGPAAVLLRKQNVVVLVALERRIGIDKVNGIIRHVAPHDVKVVAEV